MRKYFWMGWIIPKKMKQKELTIVDTALTIARAELAKKVQEVPKGSNWGDEVKKYLISVGINFPAPWCMAFVYWVFNQSAKEMSVTNPLIKTGGVLRQWNEVPKKYKKKDPVRGCIFIMDYGKGLGHTGIVEKVEGDYIHTIEGNTNDEGSREGYEVCRRKREIAKCKGFIVLG